MTVKFYAGNLQNVRKFLRWQKNKMLKGFGGEKFCRSVRWKHVRRKSLFIRLPSVEAVAANIHRRHPKSSNLGNQSSVKYRNRQTSNFPESPRIERRGPKRRTVTSAQRRTCFLRSTLRNVTGLLWTEIFKTKWFFIVHSSDEIIIIPVRSYAL